MPAIYRDLQFAPIRARFALKHHITSANPTDQYLRQLEALTRARTVDPDLLTIVTGSTICEFMGWTHAKWEYLLRTENRSGIGVPPPPRDPGAPTRAKGASDTWLLELDIVAWLLGTADGRAELTAVIEHVQNGLCWPVFEHGTKRISMYSATPASKALH